MDGSFMVDDDSFMAAQWVVNQWPMVRIMLGKFDGPKLISGQFVVDNWFIDA